MYCTCRCRHQSPLAPLWMTILLLLTERHLEPTTISQTIHTAPLVSQPCSTCQTPNNSTPSQSVSSSPSRPPNPFHRLPWANHVTSSSSEPAFKAPPSPITCTDVHRLSPRIDDNPTGIAGTGQHRLWEGRGVHGSFLGERIDYWIAWIGVRFVRTIMRRIECEEL
jgi:hypothetical protein